MSPRSRVLVVGSVLGLLTGLLLLAAISPGRPYSAVNTGDDGLSMLLREHGAVWITSLSELGELEAPKTVLVSARTGPVREEEASAFKAFATRGGYVVAYGKREFLESLARYFDLNLPFKGRVLDPVFNVGSRQYVLVNESICGGNLVVYAPYGVDESVLRGGFAVAWSSPLSFVDLNGNDYYDLGEPIGSFPVGVLVEVGQGRVLVLFTEFLLENRLAGFNGDFVECIDGNRTVAIDQLEVRGDPLEYSKLILSSHRGRLYVAILALVLLVVAYYVRPR